MRFLPVAAAAAAAWTMSHKPSTSPASTRIQSCIDRLKQHEIEVCAFDMDLTAVRQHSRGRLKRGAPLESFLQQVSMDFVELVPHLYKHGFRLSIATHSDEQEYGRFVRPETHILGDELAHTVLRTHFEPDVASSFYVLAYNPRVRKEGLPYKRYHMEKLVDYYEVSSPHKIVFFDDDRGNVKDSRESCRVQAIWVDPKRGFVLDDLLTNL